MREVGEEVKRRGGAEVGEDCDGCVGEQTLTSPVSGLVTGARPSAGLASLLLELLLPSLQPLLSLLVVLVPEELSSRTLWASGAAGRLTPAESCVWVPFGAACCSFWSGFVLG